MLNKKILENVISQLKVNNISIVRTLEFQYDMSELAMMLLDKKDWCSEDVVIANLIIIISNIMYNNTSDEVLPLDDGIYDRLLAKYNQYEESYPVGATPLQLEESQFVGNEIQDKKIMCNVVNTDRSYMYLEDIHRFVPPIERRIGKRNMCSIVKPPISKRLINTEHKYPSLVGTLDKCKFVTKEDARLAGVSLDDPSVQIFERDFIQKHISMGVIDPHEKFDMLLELKYDGVSVEAEVENGVIVSAYSRGDTANNIASDLTPIFGGYKFPYYHAEVPMKFGVKFEAIITKRNMEYLGTLRGKTYKNCRNAIIGLLGASDAPMYAHLITLVPLATSLNMTRLEEIEFMNIHLTTIEYNRAIEIYGDYKSIIFQVRDYMMAADCEREILPFLIDGIVVSYIQSDKMVKLGRVNSVNKYSIAIKFIPKKATTIFTGYTFSIGKSGEVIPMAHFKPCEFLGGIHNKQTIHSYQRFKELNLIPGQQLEIEYRNEVMTYVSKPDNEYNRNFVGKPIEFIKTCPFCGSTIEISESGKSAKCPNERCPERLRYRAIDMATKFNFTDFSEETLTLLGITSFCELVNMSNPLLTQLGPIEQRNYLDRVESLLNNPIEDYKVLSALGFSSVGDERWKLIMKHISYDDMINMPDEQLIEELVKIKSIGSKLASSIVSERYLYDKDMIDARNMLKIITTQSSVELPKVSFTGFRDEVLQRKLNELGYDAGDYGVTSATAFVIAADKNSRSGKVNKAISKGIPVYSRDEVIDKFNIDL